MLLKTILWHMDKELYANSSSSVTSFELILATIPIIISQLKIAFTQMLLYS